jgi:hypothetical protein
MDYLPEGKVTSLVTFVKGKFIATNNSLEQRTALSIAVINDIESCAEKYTGMIKNITGQEPIIPTATAIQTIKKILDPHMLKEKVVSTKVNDTTLLQFPSPHIIPFEETKLYKMHQFAGFLTSRFAALARYYISDTVMKTEQALLPPPHQPEQGSETTTPPSLEKA